MKRMDGGGRNEAAETIRRLYFIRPQMQCRNLSRTYYCNCVIDTITDYRNRWYNRILEQIHIAMAHFSRYSSKTYTEETYDAPRNTGLTNLNQLQNDSKNT
jgi:hypothetical protein